MAGLQKQAMDFGWDAVKDIYSLAKYPFVADDFFLKGAGSFEGAQHHLDEIEKIREPMGRGEYPMIQEALAAMVEKIPEPIRETLADPRMEYNLNYLPAIGYGFNKAIRTGLKAAEHRAVPDPNFTEVRNITGQEGAVLWHGTGSKWDKVDPSYQGTGEGPAAFGWGALYKTDQQTLGTEYAKKVAKRQESRKPLHYKDKEIDLSDYDQKAYADTKKPPPNLTADERIEWEKSRFIKMMGSDAKRIQNRRGPSFEPKRAIENLRAYNSMEERNLAEWVRDMTDEIDGQEDYIRRFEDGEYIDPGMIKRFRHELPNMRRRLKESQAQLDTTRARLEALKQIDPSGFSRPKVDPQLYRVEVPDETLNEYIDWFEPLGEQPESLQKILTAFMGEDNQSNLERILYGDELDGSFSERQASVLDDLQRMSGKNFYKDVERAIGRGDFEPDLEEYYTEALSPDKATSLFMRDNGIPGIQYAAGGWRGDSVEKPKKNYVTFDPETMKPLSRTDLGEKVSYPLNNDFFGDTVTEPDPNFMDARNRQKGIIKPFEGTDSDSFFKESALVTAASQNHKSPNRLVQMTPDDFLELAFPLDYQGGPDKWKMDRLAKAIEENIPLDDIPFLEFEAMKEGRKWGYPHAQVTGHEGRHRAVTLKELGVEEMPVVLQSKYSGDKNSVGRIRWGSQDVGDFDRINPDEWPTSILGETSSDAKAFPFEQEGNWRVDPNFMDNKQRGAISFFDGTDDPMNYTQAALLNAGMVKTPYIYGESPGQMAAPRRMTTSEVGTVLDRQSQEYWGGGPMEPTPQNLMKLSDNLYQETKDALKKRPEIAEWYADNLKQAIDEATKLYPEIGTDPLKRNMFLLAKAITSNGQPVASNTKWTREVYDHFSKTGQFPIFGKGKQSPAMKQSFATANSMIQQHGLDGFVDFLHKPITVRDLKNAGFNVAGENLDTRVHGSAIFGPKIGGGFFQNLNGNFDPVTFDLWWTRTWGRHTGTMMQDPTGQREALRQVLKDDKTLSTKRKYGYSKADLMKDDKLLDEFANKLHGQFAKGGYKDKNPLNNSARNLHNRLKPNADPGSGNNRNMMRQAVDSVRQRLQDEGVEINNAAIQALLWYVEKDLYRKMNVRGPADRDNDYASAWKTEASR